MAKKRKGPPFFRRKIVVVLAAVALVAVFAGAVILQWKKGKSLSALRGAAVQTVFSVLGGRGSDWVTEESLGIVRTRTREGKTVFDLRGERVLQFLGGVQTLEGVEAVLYGEGGDMRIASDEADYDSKTGNITLRGHVTLRDGRGLEILTEKVVYSDKTGEAKSATPVVFSRGGIRGGAQVARYHMATGEVIMEGGVDMDSAAMNGADGPPIVLRAQRIAYGKIGSTLQVFGSDSSLPAPDAFASAEETQAWKDASAQIESLPTLNDTRHYRMWAPVVVVRFKGEVVDDIETRGATRVEILDTLRADATPSVIRSDRLLASYDSEQRAFRAFDFDGRVSLRHADMTAYANRLCYDVPERRADMFGNAEAVSRAYILRSETMTFHEEDERLEGRGAVQAVARHGEGMRFPLPGEDPVHVYADEVTMWRGEERTEFRGAAVARRGEDTISAATLVFLSKEGVLEAREQVATILMSVGSDKAASTDKAKKDSKESAPRLPTLIGARFMRYEDAARLAVYRGGAHLSRQDVSVRGEEIHAFFTPADAEKTGVERVMARRNVTVESPGRIGNGDWAEYSFAKDEATLGGERDIEVRELETGRVARGRVLTYGLQQETLGIYTDAHGRTVSTSRGSAPTPRGTESAGAPPPASPATDPPPPSASEASS